MISGIQGDLGRCGLALREREGSVVFGEVGDFDAELVVDFLLDLVGATEISELLDGGGVLTVRVA